MNTKLFMVLGFAVGTLAGFIYGKKANENTPSNVKGGYSDGVVTITADVGNIAKSALTDARADIATGASEWLRSIGL